MRKGFDGNQVITVLSNLGANGPSYTFSLGNTGYTAGQVVVEVLSCTQVTADGNGNIVVSMGAGLPKVGASYISPWPSVRLTGYFAGILSVVTTYRIWYLWTLKWSSSTYPFVGCIMLGDWRRCHSGVDTVIPTYIER